MNVQSFLPRDAMCGCLSVCLCVCVWYSMVSLRYTIVIRYCYANTMVKPWCNNGYHDMLLLHYYHFVGSIR